MDEFPLKKCVIILDRGFYSIKIVVALLSLGTSFIQPLRRNSKLIDYSLEPDRLFAYRGRGIKYAVKELQLGGRRARLLLYEDVLLRGEEHSNLIKLRLADGDEEADQPAAEIDERSHGKISILTDLDWGGDRIYGLYKEREDIEQAFDAMKNELENDKSCLGDDAVRGYLFVSFLSLYLYFRVLEMIMEAGLAGKISVSELLFQLSKVYLIKYGDGKERLSEVPSNVEGLISKLNIDILPKN